MRKRTSKIGIATVIALAILAGVALESTHAASEPQFIDIFRNSYRSDAESTGVEKRFAAAAGFIEECCKTSQDVVQLLLDNGFKVKTHQGLKSELPTKEGVVAYDEIVSGTRSPGWPTFWLITTTYRADIYLRNGSVVYVVAMVDTAMP